MDWESHANITAGDYQLQDLWNHVDLGRIEVGSQNWTGTLEPHDNWAFKLTAISGASNLKTFSVGLFVTIALLLTHVLNI